MPSPTESSIEAEIAEVLTEMTAGARAMDPDRIRAAYAPHPTVAINGTILPDFDTTFGATRQWFGSLRQLEVTYDDVHLAVLAPDAAVATMSHHLRWTDADGTPGEWHSAWTAVFQRRASGWQIIYSHESTPASPPH